MMNRKLAASFLLVLFGALLSGRSAHADGGGLGCFEPPDRIDRVQRWELEFQGATLNGEPIDSTTLPTLETGPNTRDIDLARLASPGERPILVPLPNAAGHLTAIRFDAHVVVVFEREVP